MRGSEERPGQAAQLALGAKAGLASEPGAAAKGMSSQASEFAIENGESEAGLTGRSRSSQAALTGASMAAAAGRQSDSIASAAADKAAVVNSAGLPSQFEAPLSASGGPSTLETQARMAQVSERLNLFKEISNVSAHNGNSGAAELRDQAGSEDRLLKAEDSAELGDLSSGIVSGTGFATAQLGQTASSQPLMATSKAGEAQEPLANQLTEPIQLLIRGERSGEARVKLNPDQLGEVVLSMQVQDGRASLQILTQNKEAQALIERDLDDLRRSLAANQVSLDRVEIKAREISTAEVLTQAGADQNSAQNPSSDPRGFFQQFQGQGFSRRDEFLEMPGISQYQRTGPPPRGPEPLKPIGEARRTQDGRGERVNKVV